LEKKPIGDRGRQTSFQGPCVGLRFKEDEKLLFIEEFAPTQEYVLNLQKTCSVNPVQRENNTGDWYAFVQLIVIRDVYEKMGREVSSDVLFRGKPRKLLV